MEPTRVCHVAAIPYPGRGHINPMMDICRQLVTRKPGIVISLVVTEEWARLIELDPRPDSVRVVTVPNMVPSERVRSRDMAGFVEAVLTRLGGAVEEVLDRLEPPVSFVVADCVLSWAVGAANRRSIPLALLWTMSASLFSVIYHLRLLRQNGHLPVDLSERGQEVVDYIPGISPIRLKDLPRELFNNEKNLQAALVMASEASKAQYFLCNSVHDLEPEAFNVLKSQFPFPIYPIGPTFRHDDNDHSQSHISPEYHLNWLDSQPDGSVLYVSFGSFLSVSDEEMDKIVVGIRRSGVRYAWTGRGGFGPDVVVVPGRDQQRVLSHRSVGGFWTHCGWNSVMEGIYFGVPMICFPIFWDQFLNSKLVVDDWKIGVRVRGERDVDEVVKRFMDRENGERKVMMDNIREVRDRCREAIVNGGVSDASLHAFVRDL